MVNTTKTNNTAVRDGARSIECKFRSPKEITKDIMKVYDEKISDDDKKRKLNGLSQEMIRSKAGKEERHRFTHNA